MKLCKLLFLFYVSVISLGASPEIGKAAPGFALPAHDGKNYSLESFKGSYVVLEWFNDGCPYVKKFYDKEFSKMQQLQKKWTAKKEGSPSVVWLSVLSSAPGKQGHLNAEGAAAKKTELQANMSAILLDPDGKVGKLYEAKTTPHMFVIDPEGVLRYMGAIDDQPSARTSSLAGAKNYVEQALEAMMKGEAVATAETKPYGCSVKYKSGWF